MMVSPSSARRPRRVRLVANAFFDDGKSFGKTGFVCLCGYVSDDPGWYSFDREWVALLKRNNIGRLHTSDFLSAGGEYKNLRDTTTFPERVNTIKDFISVIQKHVLCGVAIGLDSVAFREVLAYESKKQSPEDWCFYRAVKRTLGRCALWEWGLPVSLVFDDAEEHSMRFYGAYRKLRRAKAEIRDALCAISFG